MRKEFTKTNEQRDATQVADIFQQNLQVYFENTQNDIKSCLRPLKKRLKECYDILFDSCMGFDDEAMDIAAGLLFKLHETEKSARLYSISASLGSSNAMFQLGEILLTLGMNEEAFRFLRSGAEDGELRCMYLLATCYRTGTGVEQDLVEAHNWECAAEESDPFGYEYAKMMMYSDIQFRAHQESIERINNNKN